MKIEITFEGNKIVNANMNGMIVKTDQPVKAGGNGSAPSPFDLFLASIGTCAGIFVKSFCDQRGISTENIKLSQELEFDAVAHLVKKINIEIQVPIDFPEKYKEALVNAANLCSVKKHLHQPPTIEVYTKTI